MEDIIYLKKVNNYDDIIKNNHNKIPLFLKRIIFLYKNIFNVITKKKINNYNIWILPIQEKYSKNKINNIVKKLSLKEKNKYVLSEDLISNNIYKLMDTYNIKYLNGQKLKKVLIIKILEYINNLQNTDLNNMELTLLVNNLSEINVYLIESLSKLVKNIKIVSLNIYKFKKLEEKLYNEYGIAIQFSNSYKKSLLKSKIIINLDFNKIDINEYDIFNKAIIINCMQENVKIKSKLFNGIIINSCNIKFKKEIQEIYKKIEIYNKYDTLLLYESFINNEKDFENIFNKLNKDKITISSLIGNNGIINKKEIKNINKKSLTNN